jgi:hypothetical protein
MVNRFVRNLLSVKIHHGFKSYLKKFQVSHKKNQTIWNFLWTLSAHLCLLKLCSRSKQRKINHFQSSEWGTVSHYVYAKFGSIILTKISSFSISQELKVENVSRFAEAASIVLIDGTCAQCDSASSC